MLSTDGKFKAPILFRLCQISLYHDGHNIGVNTAYKTVITVYIEVV